MKGCCLSLWGKFFKVVLEKCDFENLGVIIDMENVLPFSAGNEAEAKKKDKHQELNASHTAAAAAVFFQKTKKNLPSRFKK